MKCKRCGQIISDDTKICECGFNIEEDKLTSVIYNQKSDPDVSEKNKNTLVDNPVLTFLFGISSIIVMLLFLMHPGFVVLYFLLDVVLIVATLLFAQKPTKVRLEATRNVGKWLAYVSFSVLLFKSVFLIINLFF
ncbi:MAG: hypothetical protein PHP65_04875 [Bacilli bacterium]|jgi:hypothetical protein|nr:hypothetical protein [Bacilli bacterium]